MTAPGLRLHPRAIPVQAAGADLTMALIDFQGSHELTDVEMLRALLEQVQHISTRMLRAERHPDNPDQKADEA